MYPRVVRCKKCRLSGDVLSAFRTHQTRAVCAERESDAMPSKEDISSAPTPELDDCFPCESCTEAAVDAYEPYEVACFVCDTHLGTNEDVQQFPATSMVGQHIGADEAGLDRFALCNDCTEDARDALNG
jgi:hypothetical protein